MPGTHNHDDVGGSCTSPVDVLVAALRAHHYADEYGDCPGCGLSADEIAHPAADCPVLTALTTFEQARTDQPDGVGPLPAPTGTRRAAANTTTHRTPTGETACADSASSTRTTPTTPAPATAAGASAADPCTPSDWDTARRTVLGTAAGELNPPTPDGDGA